MKQLHIIPNTNIVIIDNLSLHTDTARRALLTIGRTWIATENRSNLLRLSCKNAHCGWRQFCFKLRLLLCEICADYRWASFISKMRIRKLYLYTFMVSLRVVAARTGMTRNIAPNKGLWGAINLRTRTRRIIALSEHVLIAVKHTQHCTASSVKRTSSI